MNVKTIIKPVVEEAAKFVDTAKEQVTPSGDQKSKEDTKQLVEDNYKPGEKKPQKPQESDEVKKQRLRSELHSQYYQSLVNRPKAPEEKPAEKAERQKMEDLQEAEKKEKPMAVKFAAQKTEKFPGASG